MSQIEIDSTTPISEIMSKRVVTVSPDDSLGVVRRLFDEHRFHHLLVVENGVARGVISHRDLLKHLSPFVGTLSEAKRDAWTLEKRVHQIMSRGIVWAEPTTPITEAALMMAANRIGKTESIGGYEMVLHSCGGFRAGCTRNCAIATRPRGGR